MAWETPSKAEYCVPDTPESCQNRSPYVREALREFCFTFPWSVHGTMRVCKSKDPGHYRHATKRVYGNSVICYSDTVPVIPSHIFYDNACNLLKSMMLRFPRLAVEARLLCDRFHYRTHTCPSVFDPDTFSTCDNLLTSGAEAINSRLATSRSHIRFLSGENLVPFLFVKILFLNLRANVRRTTKKKDIEDVDVFKYARNSVPCRCDRCTQGIHVGPTSDTCG